MGGVYPKGPPGMHKHASLFSAVYLASEREVFVTAGLLPSRLPPDRWGSRFEGVRPASIIAQCRLQRSTQSFRDPGS